MPIPSPLAKSMYDDKSCVFYDRAYEIAVAPGIYIVRSGNNAKKIVVK